MPDWRILLAGGCGVLVLLLALQHQSHRADDAETALATAQDNTRTAQGQATLNQTGGSEALKAEALAVRAGRKAEETRHDVQAAPGAPQAVPGPVLDAWLAGLRVLRNEGYSVPFPVDPGGRDPAGSVPKGG